MDLVVAPDGALFLSDDGLGRGLPDHLPGGLTTRKLDTVMATASARLRDRLRALAGAARRRRALLVTLLIVVVLAPPIVFGVWAWRTAAGVDLGRLEEAALIYAAGQVLPPGVSIEAADLGGRSPAPRVP